MEKINETAVKILTAFIGILEHDELTRQKNELVLTQKYEEASKIRDQQNEIGRALPSLDDLKKWRHDLINSITH
jgi:protein-arginine kinase activator protein McsA